jgi:D-3-phosphoglycerate dehydrogenase
MEVDGMEKAYKVLMYETMHARGTRLLEATCDMVYASSLDENSLVRQVRNVNAIIIRANGAVTRKIIEAAPGLKVIGRHGVGLETIDVQAAKDNGVQVVYTPVANSESVAEHFVALALMLSKKIRLADIALRQGYWKARYELIGTELREKNLGVVGFGKIGQQTARICHYGFGMRVLYHDVISYPDAERELNAVRKDAKDVFAEADFISINLPLLPQTRHFVNAELIGCMKPSAFIINMARGPIWNEKDLIQALQQKKIAGAGSDVYEEEPASAKNPLFQLDNFVGTPHMSAHTDESMMRMSMVAEDVLAVLAGRKPRYPAPGF